MPDSIEKPFKKKTRVEQEAQVKHVLRGILELINTRDRDKIKEGEEKFKEFVNNSAYKEYLKKHPVDASIVNGMKIRIDALVKNLPEPREPEDPGTMIIQTTKPKTTNKPAEPIPEQQKLENWQLKILKFFTPPAEPSEKKKEDNDEVNQHRKRKPIGKASDLFSNQTQQQTQVSPAKANAEKQAQTKVASQQPVVQKVRPINKQPDTKHKALDRGAQRYVRLYSLLNHQENKCNDLIKLIDKNKPLNDAQKKSRGELSEALEKIGKLLSKVESQQKNDAKNLDGLEALLKESKTIMTKIAKSGEAIRSEQKQNQMVTTAPSMKPNS